MEESAPEEAATRPAPEEPRAKPPPRPGVGARVAARMKAFFGQWLQALKKDRWAWVELVSAVVLIGALGAYLARWVTSNHELLFDPAYQNDDARTALFPFHRYGPEGALADDPVAQQTLVFNPPGVWFLYRVLVPLSNLYVASKLVQGLALMVVVWAAVVLAKARRAGIAAGVLLMFLLLHDSFAVNRLAGGHGRSFAFPLASLWIAGALAGSRRTRAAAAFIGALFYPSVMMLILGAEGVYAVRGAAQEAWRLLLRRILRYVILVAACFACTVPTMIAVSHLDLGSIHTLAQGEKEPAFGKSGRLWLLPFSDPGDDFGKAFMAPLSPNGRTLFPGMKAVAKRHGPALTVGLLGVVLIIFAARATPAPTAAIAFAASSVVLYMLSRLLAFRLYSPERYYSFGMRMTAAALMLAAVAHLAARLRPRVRAAVRNVVALCLITFICVFLGDGIVAENGMTIHASTHQKLYAFVRTLPTDVRFASHPKDGDSIPYWGARACLPTYETLPPWYYDSWQRLKAQAEDTLRALYATDQAGVLDFAKRNGVTHFLLNKTRYGAGFAEKAASFEPFTSFARTLVAGRSASSLVLGDLPESAVVFRDGPLLVVDVAKLDAAWSAK
jgi:hypothetical protein